MKIYFTAAIVQRPRFGKNYLKIVKALEEMGHTVKADHILEGDLEKIENETDQERLGYYRNMIKWINECDLMISEVSFPSTIHIGHEITLALNKGKTIIALYSKGCDPFLLRGITSEKLRVVEYDLLNLKETLGFELNQARSSKDKRFTILLQPEIISYLDNVSKNKKIPRAVFIRNLIKDKMETKK